MLCLAHTLATRASALARMQLGTQARSMLWWLCLFIIPVAGKWLIKHRGYADPRWWWLIVILVLGAVVGAVLLLPERLILHKIIALLLMPAGLLWLASWIVFLFVRMPRAARMMLFCAIILFTLAGNTWLGNILKWSLERPYVVHDPRSLEPFDAILVLGGGTGIGANERPQLSDSGDRVFLAAQLYLAQKTDILITSGQNITGNTDAALSLSAQTAALWTSIGIPPQGIMQLTEPRNTSEEMIAFQRLQREHGWQRIGLISSAWHLRRAMALAQKQGLHLIPLAADSRGGMPQWHAHELVPQGQGFLSVQRALWEYLGAAVGR